MEAKIAKIDENTEEEEEICCVPNWLIESLEWIDRKQMAQCALSYSSRTFRRICWSKLHGNVRPREIKQIKIELDKATGMARARDSCGYVCDAKILPIPIVPPPDWVTGFRTIQICFLDGQVMKFMESILPKILSIYVDFSFRPRWRTGRETGNRQWMARNGELLAMLSNKMDQLNVAHLPVPRAPFKRFAAHFPIELLDKCRCLKFDYTIDLNILLGWLSKAHPEIKQKIALVYCENHKGKGKPTFMERIKKDFQMTTHPVNFFVYTLRMGSDEEFTMENEHTNEVLAAYSKPDRFNRIEHFLIRHPKGESEHWRREGERQFWEWREGKLRPDRAKINIEIYELGNFNDSASTIEDGNEKGNQHDQKDEKQEEINLANISEMVPCSSSSIGSLEMKPNASNVAEPIKEKRKLDDVQRTAASPDNDGRQLRPRKKRENAK